MNKLYDVRIIFTKKSFIEFPKENIDNLLCEKNRKYHILGECIQMIMLM
jgi:hypothetical protein